MIVVIVVIVQHNPHALLPRYRLAFCLRQSCLTHSTIFAAPWNGERQRRVQSILLPYIQGRRRPCQWDSDHEVWSLIAQGYTYDMLMLYPSVDPLLLESRCGWNLTRIGNEKLYSMSSPPWCRVWTAGTSKNWQRSHCIARYAERCLRERYVWILLLSSVNDWHISGFGSGANHRWS